MEQEKIHILKEKQSKLDLLKSNLSAKKEMFNTENAGLLKEVEVMEDSINTTKEEIKIQAIRDFKENGIKKLYGGIGIRVTSKLFYEEKSAIAWAKENMPVALVENIDKKQFETYAKSNDLAFVEKTETITATFPREIII